MNYPLWNLFLTMLWLFVWIVLIVLVVWVILSIFRSSDLSGWGKVGWLVLVILVPFIGVFAYLIVRGARLAGEQVEAANAPQDEAARAYERFEAQGARSADELTKLADLRDRGVITDEEFQKGKNQILG
jgi:type VI protein secretion system component VasK